MLRSLTLSVKDGLRGIRHITLSLRNWFATFAKASPRPVRKVGQALIDRFDRIADHVDRNTSRIAHRYLDPTISRRADAAVLSRIITMEEGRASVIFAKLNYDNLKPVVAYLCDKLDHEGHFFISETLGAVAYGRGEAEFTESQRETEKAAILVRALLRIGMVRTSTSANAGSSTDDITRQIGRLGSFATILWLVIERESTPESEYALLFDCCDLALAQLEAIENAIDDQHKLAELIKFSRDAV